MSGLSTSWSYSSDRTFTIEVTGSGHQGLHRQTNYAIKVPYSRMGAAIRGIQRSGGAIGTISVDGIAKVDETPQVDEMPQKMEQAEPQIIEPPLKSVTQAIVHDLIALDVEPKSQAKSAVSQSGKHPVAHGFQAIETGKKTKKRKR